MPYIPPLYSALRETTAVLVRIFDRTSGRYFPPPYEVLVREISVMEAKYRRRVAEKPNTVTSVVFGKPVVNSQYLALIDGIRYLAEFLPRAEPDSAEYIEQHSILLGSLLHFYLKIDDTYDKDITGKIFTKLGYTKDVTGMYPIIKELLAITEVNRLDSLNVLTRCRAYLEYLRKIQIENPSDLIRYVPSGVEEFFQQLEARVKEAEDFSRPMLDQIKYLTVIQSFDALLAKTSDEVCVGLRLFSTSLAVLLKKTESPLSRDAMVACLQATQPKPSPLVCELINYLLPDDATLNKVDYSGFASKMKARLAVYNQYTLFGMYMMVLEKSDLTLPVVTETLKTALGITSSEVISEDLRNQSIEPLYFYLQKLPVIDPTDLDCGPWGTFQGLLRAVEEQKDLLRKPVCVF
jgi:hypothetical protein